MSLIHPSSQEHASPEADGTAALEELFAAYSRRVHAYCLRLLDSPEEAEDAVQATYLNAWQSLRKGFRPTHSRAWLFQIAHNVCMTSLRTRSRGSVESPCPASEIDEAFASPRPDLERLLGLNAAVASLPEKQRSALLLRDWRGLSYQEIAAELQLSYSAVETLIFRARRSVAGLLEAPWRTRLTAVAVAPVVAGKWALATTKSLFGAQVGTVKWALGLALAATAPLVLFGLVQKPLERADREARPAKPTPPLVAGGVLGAAVARESALRDGSWTDAQAAADPPESSNPAARAKHKKHASGADAGSPSASGAKAKPEPKDGAEETKATVCHGTAATTHPEVTIKVGQPALPALLAHGDEKEECSP